MSLYLEDRRKLRLNDPSLRVDRAARRERLSARGKRRGRGGAGIRDGNSKRRKDDGDICIFYLQGKCHKVNYLIMFYCVAAAA